MSSNAGFLPPRRPQEAPPPTPPAKYGEFIPNEPASPEAAKRALLEGRPPDLPESDTASYRTLRLLVLCQRLTRANAPWLQGMLARKIELLSLEMGGDIRAPRRNFLEGDRFSQGWFDALVVLLTNIQLPEPSRRQVLAELRGHATNVRLLNYTGRVLSNIG